MPLGDPSERCQVERDVTASQNRARLFHPGWQIAMARPMLGAIRVPTRYVLRR